MGKDQIKEAIILAGGFGTRLNSLIKQIPKPMAPIKNRPFLEYIFDYLEIQKISKIILSVGYKAEIIRQYFGNTYNTISLRYCVEKSPLGTGGAIKKTLEMASERNVLVLNGDSFFALNLNEMLEIHLIKNADVTIALKPMKNIDRYGTVKIENGWITSFEEKAVVKKGLINTGVYLFRSDIFSDLEFPETFSIERELFEKRVSKMHIAACISNGFFIDIGVPDDYEKAKTMLKEI